MTKQTQVGLDDLNPRSCIVSGEKLEKSQMVRFVAGPENRIFPDLKNNLPGRGVWVENNKASVSKAVEKRLFTRAMKQEVQADPDLPELLDSLILKQSLQALAIAKKAGRLITGFAKVDSAIRSNKADLLMHAKDAAADGKRKLASATAFVVHMGGAEIKTVSCWSGEEMSAALGLGNAMHVAAIPGGATRNLIAAIEKLENYRA